MRSAPARIFVFAVFATASLHAAGAPTWLDRVSPVITSAEKKAYLALNAADRAKFEENFFANKALSASEYFQRLEYVDSVFGSGKTGSGANTDQGAVYLAIGPPVKISHHPSSRIFVPMEIWYYDIVPGVLNTELRLIFYQKNGVGFPKLYSPTTDTIRALLISEAATVHAFGPNDSLTESDVRQVLTVPPSDDEILSAAANVATGIKYSGNDEIIGLVTSPGEMLRRARPTEVTARLIVTPAKMDVFATPSPYGGEQIDFRFEVTAAHELEFEILQDATPVYRNLLHLKFAKAQPIFYTHRADLLPGSYRVVLSADGRPATFPLEVKKAAAMSEIVRADLSDVRDRRQTPFQLEGHQLELNSDGKFAAIALTNAEKVTWMIRRGSEVVWRQVTDPALFTSVNLTTAHLPPGTYLIEAVTANDSRATELIIHAESARAESTGALTLDSSPTLISYNANLAPAARMAFLGHQWLLRGQLDQARRALQASLERGPNIEAEIELARADALSGAYDAARDRVRGILQRDPDNFEALSVFAYIEAGLQDYKVASDLYRRALAIQDSPALRAALAKLPPQ